MVISCLKRNATSFAEILGKNTGPVFPKGVTNAGDIFCQARSPSICVTHETRPQADGDQVASV
jgi:hypothetical protein